MIAFADVLNALVHRPLAEEEARGSFEAILAGGWTPAQVGAFAAALRMRADHAETIAAGARAMRGAMHVVEHGFDVVVDTCGTGGDGAHTLNLSTAAAIVVAACGVAVAKHGNRSVSSRCGSADVIEALGIPLVDPSRQSSVLRDARIAFLFAPAHHPALKHAAQARRELGVRTIFNALGPLANPARATHQLVGVYDDELRPIAARALAQLGVTRAWVVRSEDGLDEVSPCGAETRVSEVSLGDGAAREVRERIIRASDFGVKSVDRAALAGGGAEENARAIIAILEGEDHPAMRAVVLNAAAALAVVDERASLVDCAERARDAIASRRARETLEVWRASARRHDDAAFAARSSPEERT